MATCQHACDVLGILRESGVVRVIIPSAFVILLLPARAKLMLAFPATAPLGWHKSSDCHQGRPASAGTFGIWHSRPSCYTRHLSDYRVCPRQAREALTLVTKKTDSVSQERSLQRAALMARVQDGDRESCRELLDDVGPMVMNFLRRRIADRDELDDVYQDTLMAFFQARHTFEPSRPLEPWLFAIARNTAADHARRYWTRAGVEQHFDEMPETSVVDEPRPDPDLEAVMARLPDPQRKAFAMLKIEGLSIEQAADRAGVSVGALRGRAHRAYKALRKLISE